MNHLISSILAFFLLGAHTVTAQSNSSDFTLPLGWEETENWLPLFQEAFGNEASFGSFFYLLSEADFLLVHPDHKAFVIIWEESENLTSLSSPTVHRAASSSSLPGSYMETSYPQLQIDPMTQTPRAIAKQVSLILPTHSKLIHVMIIAPASYGNYSYLQDIPRQIAGSWRIMSR